MRSLFILTSLLLSKIKLGFLNGFLLCKKLKLKIKKNEGISGILVFWDWAVKNVFC